MTICRILGHLIISVGLAFAVTKYTKDTRKGDLTRMRIVYTVLFLLLPAIMMTINFAYYSSWRNFYQYLDTTSTETESKFVAKINAMQPGQKKSAMSHLHAQYIYRYEGKITEYQSPAGLSESYIPDEQDKEARRLITTNRALDHSKKVVMKSTMILYGFSYIWIFYFGFIAPKSSDTKKVRKGRDVMKYILIIFISMVAINGYGNEDEQVKAHIANDFAECSAFYRIMSKGKSGNIKKYNKARKQCYAYAVELSNAAATEARIESSIKDQLKLINNDYSNSALLTNKYDALCESLLARRIWKGKNTSRGF